MSSSGGYLAMAKTAIRIGANTFQFFSRNPRGGRARALDADDLKAYKEYAKRHGIGTVVAHAPYTMNLCSDKAHIRRFARDIMREDLERLQNLDKVVYNFHPGNHVGQGIDTGIAMIVDALNEVLTEEIRTPVLLETMAGKGSEIGRSFGELARIIDGVNLREKIGVCMDSCHVHDAGYDPGHDLDGVLDEFNRLVGLERLGAFHLNDSKHATGSGKDRHAKIGEGVIGLDAVVRMMSHRNSVTCPLSLKPQMTLMVTPGRSGSCGNGLGISGKDPVAHGF